ncbi:MAG: hypothetical protein CMN75_00740, partial [Spirochaeta sp.]|nr:hypothetical protein [Spirochaeta sp.]
TFGESGLPERLHIDYGGQYEVELEFTHLADFPLHPIGHVVATSNPKPMKRTIAVTEWVPDNIADLIHGRVPGCTSHDDMNTFDAKIVNHCVVPANS